MAGCGGERRVWVEVMGWFDDVMSLLAWVSAFTWIIGIDWSLDGFGLRCL